MMMMVVNALTMFVLLSGFLVYDYYYAKNHYWKKYELTAELMEDPIIEAIQQRNIPSLDAYFKDILESQGVVQIVLFDPHGQVLTSLPKQNFEKFKEYTKDSGGTYFVKSMKVDGELIGFVGVKPNLNHIYQNLSKGIYLCLLLFSLLFFLSFLMATKIANIVTLPVALLTQTAKNITEHKDFNLRAQKVSDDEFGVLTDTFNLMLKEIQKLEEAYSLQLEISTDSYNKVKFLLEKTEQNKRRLENEVIERISSQNELKNIRNHLNDIINSMPSILVCVNGQGVITDCNQAACVMSGESHESLIHKPLEETFSMIADCRASINQSVKNHQAKKLEKVHVKLEDKEYFYNILIYPLTQTQEQGAVIRMDDVTTQVRMENMMIQTEKMISVGGLAAGMAHEINNPLGGILQSTQNLSRRIDPHLPKNKEVAESLGGDIQVIHQYLQQRGIVKFVDGIKECGERAAAIVKNMLQFSRKSERNKAKPCDLVQLVDRSISLAANDYDLKKSFDFRKITMIKDYAQELPEIPCVATEIEQVVLNLLRNAAQAMQEQENNSEPTISVSIKKDKDFCYISIKDNGPGIPLQSQQRIFEPFYTTKEVGVGTGLGLSVSYFIIHSKHAGDMRVHSVEGEGTEFVIALPIQVVEVGQQHSA